MKVLALVTGFLFCMIISPAIQDQTFTPRYTTAIHPNVNGFYEYLPAGYNLPQNANKKYPVIFYFHGGGELGSVSSNNLEKLKQSALPLIINTGKMPASFTLGSDNFSFIIICPQFINGPVSTPPTPITAAQVDAVINYTFAQPYKIDRGKVYLTGFSLGGKPAWEYMMGGLQNARKIAASIPISSWCYLPSLTLSNLQYVAQAGVAVWALHQPSDASALAADCYTNYLQTLNSYNPVIPAQGTLACIPGGGAPCGHDSSFWNTIYTHNMFTLPGTGLNIYQWLYSFRLTNYWKGTSNALWENPANWSFGIVPDTYTNVVINAGTPFSPVINSNISVHGVKVQPGARLTINSGFTINITGKGNALPSS